MESNWGHPPSSNVPQITTVWRQFDDGMVETVSINLTHGTRMIEMWIEESWVNKERSMRSFTPEI